MIKAVFWIHSRHTWCVILMLIHDHIKNRYSLHLALWKYSYLLNYFVCFYANEGNGIVFNWNILRQILTSDTCPINEKLEKKWPFLLIIEKCKLLLLRNMTSLHKFKYIYVYYLPSGLFVIVSWVSFLIPPEVIPGRMAMLITLFLVLINIFNSITTNSPNAQGKMTTFIFWVIQC